MKHTELKSFLLIVVLVLVVDQFTKYLALSFQLTTVINNGISFGMAQQLLILPFISLCILGLIGYWWIQQPNLGLALVFAGGLSNIFDRFQWRGVVDWLVIPGTGLHNNLADYAIFGGVLIWAYTTFREKKPSHD